MAWDLGDALDVLRSLADWPGGASGDQGPARKRVDRWSGRVVTVIILTMAIAVLVVWLRSENFAAFDRDALPAVSLGLLALVAAIAVHCVAAIIANIVDGRARKR